MTKIWHPEIFQGTPGKRNYFEGWYFKLVDKDEKLAIAIIPGIALAGERSHSFIQVFSGRSGTARYFSFGKEDFIISDDPFSVRVGASLFSLDRLSLDIEQDGHRIQSDLEFRDVRGWPVKPFSPGAMGWYRFVPFMECYHGVLSFNHAIRGSLVLDGERIDMTGGKGYIEKDWGRSMPASWIWMQTNHFDIADASLFASIAEIPWIGRTFPGFIFGLSIRETLYSFATYTGARLSLLDVTEKEMRIIVEDGRYVLGIGAEREIGVDLPTPRKGEMVAKVNESLRSRIRVELREKKSGNLVFSDTGRNAGLEVVGNTSRLFPRR